MVAPGENLDIDSLVQDPTDHFATPMDVVRNARLTRDEKKRILESWVRDAELLSQAEAENMPGQDRPRLQEAHRRCWTSSRRGNKSAEIRSEGIGEQAKAVL